MRVTVSISPGCTSCGHVTSRFEYLFSMSLLLGHDEEHGRGNHWDHRRCRGVRGCHGIYGMSGVFRLCRVYAGCTRGVRGVYGVLNLA